MLYSIILYYDILSSIDYIGAGWGGAGRRWPPRAAGSSNSPYYILRYIGYHDVLCYVILYYIMLYYIIVFCIINHYMILCYIVLYYIIPYHIILHYIMLCYVMLCYIIV